MKTRYSMPLWRAITSDVEQPLHSATASQIGPARALVADRDVVRGA